MPRRRAPAGQRHQIIAHAYLLYHRGVIGFVELARTVKQFRR